MAKKRVPWPITWFLALSLATSLSAQRQVWDFLGGTHVDGNQDHDKIQVTRHDGFFRAIQLRVSGDAIFFDRLVVHFGNGTSEELAVRDRISSEGRNHVIDLPGERRVLESIELWYYKERWEHNPRVSLYGTR